MYFVLKCFDPPNAYLGRIEYRDDDPFRFWNTGDRFDDEPKEPLRARVILDKQSVLAEMWETPLPLMTARLHKALLAAGVSNLDTYPVLLEDKQSGNIIDGYLAFNIIGVIAAADAQGTRYAPGSTDRLISADIDHLIIDPEKVAGGKMFRLAESVSAILVSEDVKTVIEATGISTLTFMPPETWVG
ncbi:hypothetical protein OPU71_10775 [Niveibacterium sp. 24ML]|uniref:imm11 family protein n=1 Tax=Niveibacterium sp. 24ML TaxID=2985512 RepID=UPI00227118CC|nr:hypothetical protein [Niveibacterium sp. 24ML]MCX9156605.1 hypothetical protein [Niveibacterium sp. 24ML]